MKKITLGVLMFFMSFCCFAQFEGFDGTWTTQTGTGAGGPAGWAIANVAGPAFTWAQANGTTQPAYAGGHAAYLVAENVTNGTTTQDWLISPIMSVPANGQLRFQSRLWNLGDQGNIYKIMVSPVTTANTVAEQTTLANFGTTPLVQWTELQINPSQLDYTEKVVSLAAYANTNVYIAFVMEGDAGDRWLVDDFKVVPECAPPSNGIATNISGTGADLSWANPSGATNFQVEVVLGTASPTGTGVNTTSGGPTYAASGLTAATAYKYYVRALCGTGNLATWSAWAGPFNFTTSVCAAGTQCNYTFTLTDSFGDGWNGNTMTVTQNGITMATFGATFTTGTGPVVITVPLCNNLPFQLFWNNGGNWPGEVGVSITNSFAQVLYNKPAGTGAPNSVLFTGQADCDNPACLPVTGLTATGIGTNTANLGWAGPATGNWQYYVVPTGTAAPAFATPGTPTTTNPVAATATNAPTVTSLTPATTYQFYVRVVCTGGTFSTWAGPFSFTTLPTCSPPTGLALGTFGATSATFNWVAPAAPAATPGSYDYYWSNSSTPPTGATAPTGNVTPTTTTQSSLTPSTTYYIWVRSHCSATDSSTWVGPVSFTTPQVPTDLPVAENWDSGTLNGWTAANGTQTNKWFVGTATFNSPGHSLYVSNNNGVANAYTTSANSVVHAYRDINIPTGTTDVNFSFDWKNVGETGWDFIRVWVVPASYTPPTGTMITASPDRVQIGGNFVGNANWTTFSAIPNWTAYAGGIRRVVFEWRNDGGGGAQPPGAVDNINISVITCPQPTALTATGIGNTSATLGWTSPGPATQWEYYLVPTPATAPTAATTGVLTSTTTPVVTLTPATQYQYWVRSVCGPTDKSLWSGPYTFNSTICELAQQCNYTFILTDSWGDGWNGNTMTVSQNGIPVATFGSTFTTGLGPITITVPMCNNLPFQLFWNAGGNFAGEVGVSVVNPFNQVLYSKPAGTGTQNSLLFTGEVDCLNPACLPPAGVTITDETTTTISVQWTASPVPGATYEVYYTTSGGAAPGETPTTNVVATTTPSAVITALEASTVYNIYVRTICSATSNSPWAGAFIHETDPLCPEPLDLEVTCLQSTGAAIAWTPDGAETSWEVVVQPASQPAPTSGTVVNEPLYLAEGLTPGTLYTAYVRAICPDVNGFSSWAEIDFTPTVGPGDASALCTSTVSVPSSTGAPGYGSIGCLGSTPNPIWYYFTVESPNAPGVGAPMNFTLTQVSTNGTPIDVDFAAFGPFESQLDACSQIVLAPGANPLIVACSYSGSATENFVIPNAQQDQVYALLITNFNGQAGNISLVQTNATAPNAPTTSCDPVVELGNNQVHCATESIELTANVDNPGAGTTYTYVWTLDGGPYSPVIVATGPDSQTIEVEEPGQHVIGVTVTVTDNPDLPTDEDLVVITLSPPFTAPVPAPVTLCGAGGTATIDLAAINFLGTLNPADYQVGGVYVSNANAQSGTSPINTAVPYTTGSTTLYVTIRDAAVPTCFQIVPLVITVNTTPSATISYADSPFCSSETTGAVTQTGNAGGTYTSTTGLDVNAATGAINVTNSTPGTYTVTYTIAATASCPEFVTTAQVVVVAAPVATIAYAASPYCSDAGTATVTATGTTGGTYTSTTGLDIDATTGDIDLAASTPGTYTVTYTIANTGDCLGIAVTTEVTITELPVAVISYTGSPYCSDAGVATVTLTGDAGGVYSADNGLIVDAATGEINLAANASGTYTVTYTIAAANGCAAVVVTAPVTITDLPVATFTYAYATVCQNAEAQAIQLAPGASAGTFTVDVAGLTIDAATGAITPGTSDIGTYVVTNTIPAGNGCNAVTSFVTVTIIAAPLPTFSYAATAYCADETTNPLPVLDGVAGTFTASPAGLSIDAATGAVNLGASQPGTYTVTNTVTGTPDCPTVSSIATVTVTSLPVLEATAECEGNFFVISVNFDNDDVYSEDSVDIEWTGPNGAVVGTTASVDITGSEALGTYTVVVTPLNGAICPAIAEVVVDRTTCFTPKGISPNGDGLNDNFDLTGFNVRKLVIFNRYGKEVYKFTGAYTNEFGGVASNGENLPSGTYFYMFERTNGTTETGWVYVNFEK